jgi:hypothetical protein
MFNTDLLDLILTKPQIYSVLQHAMMKITGGSRGWILGRNWDKSLKIFPPCYSQSPLLKDFIPPWSKSGLKLVCNGNIVYGNLKSDNSQVYGRKLNEIVCSWIRLQVRFHSYTVFEPYIVRWMAWNFIDGVYEERLGGALHPVTHAGPPVPVVLYTVSGLHLNLVVHKGVLKNGMKWDSEGVWKQLPWLQQSLILCLQFATKSIL